VHEFLHFVQRAKSPPGSASADRFNLELAENGVAALVGDFENLFNAPVRGGVRFVLEDQ